jgi:hypothetical protein
MQSGKITKALRPAWEPLITLVGGNVVGCFAWKFALELDDEVAVHAYRSIATDRYLLLAVDGRTFEYRDGDRYEEIPVGVALETVFTGWEEARPRPRDPDAVRALLERHREQVSAASTASSEPPA